MGCFCWLDGLLVGCWKKGWKISKQRRLPELILHLRLLPSVVHELWQFYHNFTFFQIFFQLLCPYMSYSSLSENYILNVLISLNCVDNHWKSLGILWITRRITFSFSMYHLHLQSSSFTSHQLHIYHLRTPVKPAWGHPLSWSILPQKWTYLVTSLSASCMFFLPVSGRFFQILCVLLKILGGHFITLYNV